jgi:hypothetical protein
LIQRALGYADFYMINFFFCGTGAWNQGLHLEPLYQTFFAKGFSEIGSLELFAWANFEREPPDLCFFSN